jgi:nitrogen-specific signal transduction histidine kinase/CheY-like chemotaxis protein
MVRRNGSTFQGEVSASLVTFRGKPVIQGVFKDVTEHDRLQKQLQQAQKMEAIGTLAGGVAHDFNNLIQAISGYTELLLMTKDEEDSDYRRLKSIERSIGRAGELTKQLLIFSRKVETQLQPTNLNQEVTNVTSLLKRTIPKMIHIDVHLSDDLNIIRADPVQIEQVLINLAINARDAMPEGGTLTIETRNAILDEEYSNTHPGSKPGSYVLLTVSDTGYGMDKDTQDRIFDPFYTTKDIGKGTGLGLAMVYGIVKSHGGYIMCYSEVGRGTVFKIYIPQMDPLVEGALAQSLEEPRGGYETLLLVDDEDPVRDFAEQILSRYGYTVITAASGEKALDVYLQKKGEIDLVILDLIMPGMGGRKCLEKLLDINERVKIIIASGYSLEGFAKETVEMGARSFLNKPYESRTILRAVREVLDEV